MNETQFRKEIIRRIKQNGGDAHAIETHMTSVGVPDINYQLDITHSWIETKWSSSPKKGLILRGAQKTWHMRRHRAGGTSLILAHVDFYPKCYLLFKGTKSEELINTTRVTDWMNLADYVWMGSIDWGILMEFLRFPALPPDLFGPFGGTENEGR